MTESARYRICQSSPLVTQLRLEFSQLVLAPPFTCGSAATTVPCTTRDGPLIGQTSTYISFILLIIVCEADLEVLMLFIHLSVR